MSSNIFVQRICEECGNEFTARTTVTRFCGDRCAKRAYKKRMRNAKIEQSNKETVMKVATKVSAVQNKDYLGIQDVCSLIGISRTTLWRLLKDNRIHSKKIGRKHIFTRDQIDQFISGL